MSSTLNWEFRHSELFAKSNRWSNCGYSISRSESGWCSEILGLGSIVLAGSVSLQEAMDACEAKEREGLTDVRAWTCPGCGLLILSKPSEKCPKCEQKAAKNIQELTAKVSQLERELEILRPLSCPLN